MNKFQKRPIPPEGPLDARIIILAESPWWDEVNSGRPLAGSSGNILKYWWAEAEGKIGQMVMDIAEDNYTSLRPSDHTELVRTNMRIMYLYPFKPPTRDLVSVPAEKVIKAIEEVHRAIADLKDPYVIVSMGNYATFALTGKGKVSARVRNAFSSIGFDQNCSDAEKKAGITQLRGSIYPYQDLNGRMMKVIPMIEPWKVIQMSKWTKRCIIDWKKVKREVGYKGIADPGRKHIIDPNQQQIEEYCQRVYDAGPDLKMSIDIETWGNQLSCVGFAMTPFESMTLSTFGDRKWTIPYVKWLCECEAQKVLQNGHFDWYWLDEYGVQLRNYLWDTMCLKGDVEVLTKKGWVCLKDYNVKDKVMQWEEDGKLSWVSASKLKMSYAGKMIKCSTQKHNCSYTPKHRIPFLWQNTKKLCVKQAEDFSKLQAVYIPNAGFNRGGSFKYYSIIKHIVVIQAEGHITGNSVYFEFVKKRKINRFLKLFTNKNGIEITELKGNKKKKSFRFKVSGEQIQNCLDLLKPDKQFGPWLLGMFLKGRETFIEELRYWDGLYEGKNIVYYSKNKKNAEWVATIAHTINKSAYIYQQTDKSCWVVSIKNKNYFSHRKNHITTEQFNGNVYCLTVPSSFFLIRSQGQIHVTGNSMHHCLDPIESHSLDFLASIYCPHYVYWKDEAKEAEEIIKYAKDVDALWTYNGLDCCYTRELFDQLYQKLVDTGMLEFYFNHYQRMFEPLIRTMRHGFRVDVDAQKAAAKGLRKELKELHAKLNELAGEELFATEIKTKLREPTEKEWFLLLNDAWQDGGLDLKKDGPPNGKYIDRDARSVLVDEGKTYMIGGKDAGLMRVKVVKTKKSFSKDKLSKFFYETLGLPKQYKMSNTKDGRKRSESLDESSIRKLMYKFKKAEEPGKLLLEFRSKEKEIGYLKGAWDRDGRMRCSYKMTTITGRLASSKNPMRTGINMQNLKR